MLCPLLYAIQICYEELLPLIATCANSSYRLEAQHGGGERLSGPLFLSLNFEQV